MFKKVLQVFTVLAWLPTQQSFAQSAVKPLENGFGIRIALPEGWFKDLAGGRKHYAPNIGSDCFIRYNFEYLISIRGKVSYENSGNRRLGGMFDHRSEVKCSMALLGLLIRSPRGRPGYIGVESGIAKWDIKSTFEPLVYFQTKKNVTALLVGAETRHFYFETGWDFFGFVSNRINIPENNYVHQIDNIGYSRFVSAGVKF